MNEPYQKHAMNNESKNIQKRFDDAVMVGLKDQALDVCQFVSVAAFLAIVRSPIRVPATKDMNRSLTDQMCKKEKSFFFYLNL